MSGESFTPPEAKGAKPELRGRETLQEAYEHVSEVEHAIGLEKNWTKEQLLDELKKVKDALAKVNREVYQEEQPDGSFKRRTQL